MSRNYDYDEERYRDERERDHKLIWGCPNPGCGYKYESERFVNEALNCLDCGTRTVNKGESYGA